MNGNILSSGLAALLFVLLTSTPVWSVGSGFDEGDALRYSQSAIGRTVGDLEFLDSRAIPFASATTGASPWCSTSSIPVAPTVAA